METKFVCVLEYEYSKNIFSKKHHIGRGQVVEVLDAGDGKVKLNVGNTTSKIWTKAIAIPKIMYYFEILEKSPEIQIPGMKIYNPEK